MVVNSWAFFYYNFVSKCRFWRGCKSFVAADILFVNWVLFPTPHAFCYTELSSHEIAWIMSFKSNLTSVSSPQTMTHGGLFRNCIFPVCYLILLLPSAGPLTRGCCQSTLNPQSWIEIWNFLKQSRAFTYRFKAKLLKVVHILLFSVSYFKVNLKFILKPVLC